MATNSSHDKPRNSLTPSTTTTQIIKYNKLDESKKGTKKLP